MLLGMGGNGNKGYIGVGKACTNQRLMGYTVKQKPAKSKFYWLLSFPEQYLVEPTGLEPVSKQIRRKLSTCLFMN